MSSFDSVPVQCHLADDERGPKNERSSVLGTAAGVLGGLVSAGDNWVGRDVGKHFLSIISGSGGLKLLLTTLITNPAG